MAAITASLATAPRELSPAQRALRRLARRKGAPKPNADGSLPPLDVYDRELDWVRVVTVDEAGRVSQLFHYSREVVKPLVKEK